MITIVYFTAYWIYIKADQLQRMDPDNEFMNLDFEKVPRHPRINLVKRQRVSSKFSINAESKSIKRHNPQKVKTQPSQPEFQFAHEPFSKEDNDFMKRYRQLNSQLIKPSKSSQELKLPMIAKFQQKKLLTRSRSRPTSISIAMCEKILRDKEKYPLKYKVFCLEMGYSEEEVYKLKEEDKRQLQQEYQRKKGEEYLQQMHINAKIHGKKEQTKQISVTTSNSNSKQKDKQMIHKIFGEIAQAAKLKQQSKLQKKPTQSQLRLKQIQLQQELIGHLLFKRAAKHLSKVKKSQLGYLDELRGEKKVDEALLLAIEHKIKKMRLVTQ